MQHADLTAFDQILLEQQAMVLGDGVNVEQMITINGSVRFAADRRWFGMDFYRRAIAKFLEGR